MAAFSLKKALFLLLLWQPAPCRIALPKVHCHIRSEPEPGGSQRGRGCLCQQHRQHPAGPGPQPCRRHSHPLSHSPSGAKKVTNKATLWYVPLSLKNVNKVLEVPPIQVGRLTLLPT